MHRPPLTTIIPTIHYAVVDSLIGKLVIARSVDGVCAVLPGATAISLKRALAECFPRTRLLESAESLLKDVEQVLACIASPAKRPSLQIDLRGTDFQQRVWKELLGIPAGTTASYSEIAERIGQPRAARAVARACATNRLAVVIPCHRVVRSNGGLSGYRWGLQRKRELLHRESIK